jgi:phosphatidylglycerol:prolipoprotein diacylglycerol transferase
MQPVLFRAGRFELHSYGALLMLGVAVATLVAVARARSFRCRRDEVIALAAAAFGGGLLGAYVLYLVTRLPEVARDPSLMWREPGMVFYGGLLGGAAAGGLTAAVLRIPLTAAADLAAPAVPLGHALGRVGCFLSGCCYGRPGADPIAQHVGGRHPVQLYEAAGLVVLAGALLVLERRRPRPLAVALAYVAGYAALRFGLELLRGDAVRGFVAAGLSTSQAMALATGAVALTLLVRGRGRAAPRVRLTPPPGRAKSPAAVP